MHLSQFGHHRAEEAELQSSLRCRVLSQLSSPAPPGPSWGAEWSWVSPGPAPGELHSSRGSKVATSMTACDRDVTFSAVGTLGGFENGWRWLRRKRAG